MSSLPTRWTRGVLSRTGAGLFALCVTASVVLVGTAGAATSASSTNLLHTAATQTVQSAQSGQAQMKTVACPSATDCLAIGAASSDQGVISYSTNAGTTWTPVEIFDPTTILSLNSLTCPSSIECVAVGASLEHRGVAIVGRFSKGAWTWSAPITMANESGASTPPTVSLNSVACVSVNSCVAVGTDLTNSINVTTYTTDAGESWSSDAVAAGDGAIVGGYRAELNSVSCTTPISCVAVGTDATGHAEVTYASFANQTWTWSASAIQLAGDGQGGYLNAVDCFDATTCVAVGSDVAGQGVSTVATHLSSVWSWTAETVVAPDATGSGQLLSLTCSSNGVCDAAGVDHNSQSISTQSTTGGTTWSPDVVIANDGATNATSGNDPSSITCATATRCLSVGTDSLSRAFSTTTSNGGVTWTREARFDVQSLPGEGPLSYVSCSGSLCVAVGTNDHNESVVSRSTDTGRTWSAERQLTSDASGASYVQGVSCVDDTLCVVVGWDNLSRPVTARSTNAGKTWSVEKAVGTDFSSEGFLNHVSCASIHRCVAVGWDGEGQAITSHSFDGGANWTREQTVFHDATGSGFLYSVSCPLATYCVAVGRNDQFKGVAAYSTNGGVGWSALIDLKSVTTGTGALDDVSCPRVTLCVAVGGTGTGAGASVTSRSTNGGKSWTPESTVSLDSTAFGLLTSISCPSSRLCVAGGTDGFEQAVTTYSFNQGATWSREATTTSIAHKDFLTGVSCPGTIECVAVGADTAQRGVYVPLRFAATVTFSGSAARGSMKSQVAWSAQRLHAVTFVRPGYQFVGWSFTRRGPATLKNKQRYQFLADAKLYAVWSRG